MTRKKLIQEWRKLLSRGDLVRYGEDILPVLGHAAMLDSNGNQMIEIAWNNKRLSPLSGYLAVSRDELDFPSLYDEEMSE